MCCSESSDGLNDLIREVGVLTQRREGGPRQRSQPGQRSRGRERGKWRVSRLASVAGTHAGGWDRKLGDGLWPQGRQLLSKHMGAWKGFRQRRVMVRWTFLEEAPGCPVRSLRGRVHELGFRRLR